MCTIARKIMHHFRIHLALQKIESTVYNFNARCIIEQVIKTFSVREGWCYIGIKGDGGVKSKGTRLVIEKQ